MATHRFSHRLPKPTGKTCAVVRYGAIGDVMQISSILPLLKKEGYHITVYLVPNGYEVLRNNPHVDRFIIQDIDAVPNGDLGAFWKYTAKKYDRFINLSESVERTLLAMPGNMNHGWPQETRHRLMNHNYLEFMHSIAGLPYEPQPKFYPTDVEREWALKTKRNIHAPVILWSMGGSSVHKTWPHLDAAIEFLTGKGIHVVTVGDEAGKILEQGFEKNPRIHPRCWVWTIRQSLAFAQIVDLVVGPETGLLNAVSFEDVPKIVCLSHSTEENLTRDWVNCLALAPADTPCYPCHRMHYGFEFCTEGKVMVGGEMQTVGSLCQVNISPERLVNAALRFLTKGNARVA